MYVFCYSLKNNVFRIIDIDIDVIVSFACSYIDHINLYKIDKNIDLIKKEDHTNGIYICNFCVDIFIYVCEILFHKQRDIDMK